MAIKKSEATRVTIEFEPCATVADLIEAVEDLRAKVGPDAIVRTRSAGGAFDKHGPRVRSITAEPQKETRRD